MASATLRIGISVFLLIMFCAGCEQFRTPERPLPNGSASFSAVAEHLDGALEKLGGADPINGPVFGDGYNCRKLGNKVFYWVNHWYGRHLTGSVILMEDQATGEISLLDLGCWQGLRVEEIQETSDPDRVRIRFADGIVQDGSEYYTRSFVESVDYSLAEGIVAAENGLCARGRYGMVGDVVKYRQRFGQCEVTGGKIALRFEVTETTGWEGYPKSTEVVLPEAFAPGKPGEILLPWVAPNLSEGFLEACTEAGGIRAMTVEPLSPEGGSRLTVIPEPGNTVVCGFSTPDSADWGETLWIWGE